MEIIRIPRIMQDTSKEHLLRGRTIGFVPTMGALHEGHMSLVKRAKQENHVTAVSIFVNPTQFSPSEDYQNYPRDIEGDSKKLQQEEVDILFLPDASLMYQKQFSTHIEVEGISDKLCGAFRPGHFRGVATVVAKLFNIVKPTRAYFGQKDFQQTVVIRRMARDLNMDTDIVLCPTIRERNGLAMSSRNSYLTEDQRNAASVISRSLYEASGLLESGIIDITRIQTVMREKISREPSIAEVDYAGIYDPFTLNELSEIQDEVLLAAAVRIGRTRLIDNMLVHVRKER